MGKNAVFYLRKQNVNVTTISLRDVKWKEKIPFDATSIVHLAGKAHDTSNTSAEKEYFRINTDLTCDLFDYFINSDIRDFFFFSSVKAVADTVQNVLKEETIPNPTTPYGQSKWKAEQYLNAQLLPPGKRLFILRPCMIHGPGNKGNLNLLYNVVKKGIPYPLAAYENQRSFLSIDNLLFVLKWLLKKRDISGGTYNLADDDPISTNELIRLIGEARGQQARLWHVPVPLIKGIAKLGDVTKFPLNSERLKKLTESYVVDNSKIKVALKIEHMPVGTKEGLLKTLRSF